MEVWIAVGVGAFNALLLLVLLRRPSGNNEAAVQALQQSLQSMHEKLERIERELRTEITESSRGGRQELTQNLAVFQQSQVQQLTLMQKKHWRHAEPTVAAAAKK
jgi:DNA recombination protein RmuC